MRQGGAVFVTSCVFRTATSYRNLKVVLSREVAEHENETVKFVGRHQLSHYNPALCCVGAALLF